MDLKITSQCLVYMLPAILVVVRTRKTEMDILHFFVLLVYFHEFFSCLMASGFNHLVRTCFYLKIWEFELDLLLWQLYWLLAAQKTGTGTREHQLRQSKSLTWDLKTFFSFSTGSPIVTFSTSVITSSTKFMQKDEILGRRGQSVYEDERKNYHSRVALVMSFECFYVCGFSESLGKFLMFIETKEFLESYRKPQQSPADT